MENILNPQAQSIKIFSLMLSGKIRLSVKARKYIFYMYLLLFGSCTREMVPLLLDAADKSAWSLSFECKKNYMDEKMIDNFITNRIKSKDISRVTIKDRILYRLAPKGYKELSNFLSGQEITEGIDKSHLKWCGADACGMVCRNSVHSSTVGIIFIHIASRCRFEVSDFKLNTPLDQHGNIRTGMFDQSKNRFRSDAYLTFYHPCRQEFFFENDMGTERENAVTEKLERYNALIFSAERDLCSSCIHFTIGDYFVKKEYTEMLLPSKYKMQVYRACMSVLFAASGIKENMPIGPDKTIEVINNINDGLGAPECRILNEIKKYVSEVYSVCPDITDVYSCFDRTRILREALYSKKKGCILYHINPDISYLKRREKIFEWCRNSPNMLMLVKRGLRITSSDNCSDGTDFMLSYPNLRNGGINAYIKFIERHISEFSYRGKYTDINDSDQINKKLLQSSLEEYDNISFFQSDKTFYTFANCYTLHHNKGSFRYSFENISNDVTARMRIERYLDDGAPDIPFLQIFIVYSDDIYSLKYVESLKANYSILLHRQTNVHFEQLQYMDLIFMENLL